jgi:anti-sigma factor RsiW
MKNDAGKDDILRFIYDEMTPDEAGEIEVRLQIDPELREAQEEIIEVQQELDKLRCSPSDALLSSIMRYARQSKPADQQTVSK